MTDIEYNDYDELDFGINNIDLSIQTANIDGENKILLENEMINPFFVELNKHDLDNVLPKDLHLIYKHVYIICLKNNSDINYNIFNKIITKSEYENFSNTFTLLKCSKNILYNKMHHDHAKILTSEQLSIFKQFNFENTEIIVPLYNIQEKIVNIYNTLYESQFKLNQLEDILELIKLYSISSNGMAMKKLFKMIYEIKESEYWTNPYNCNMSITDLFNKRRFLYNIDKIDNDTFSNDKKLNKHDFYQLKSEKNYKDNSKDNKTYIDISKSINNNNNNRTYFASNPSLLEFDKEKITKIFNMLDSENELYVLFNTLLVSKDYCHTVINNEYILNKMAPIINKYLPLYKYLSSYAWLTLYTEECIFKTKTTINSRYVFDINTASNLPFFPFCYDDLYQNPYISLTVSENILNSKNNCLSLPMIEGFDGYGVTDLIEFKKRFNVFTTGDVNKNIFDNIDWTNLAISGSSITACIQKKSPLFNLINNLDNINDKNLDDNNYTNLWLNYFNNYYKDSDIDLMCSEKSVFKFMDKAADVINCIEKNLNIKINSEPIKTYCIVVSGHYITHRLEHINAYVNLNWTVEDVIKNINSDIMKKYFYDIYYNTKLQTNNIFKQLYKETPNPLYNEFYKIMNLEDINISLVTYDMVKNKKIILDNEVCYYINDYIINNKVPEDKNYLALKISESIKFKIKSEHMKHNIEIFKVNNNDFFGVVAKFHLGVVRAYYNGYNVYLLPSCITALMTGINIDYNYFASIRNPIEILHKYRSRGYSVLLNKKEKEYMVKYIKNNDEFKKLYESDIFGTKNINHSIFNSTNKKDYKYINTFEDFKNYYKTKYNYNDKYEIDMLKLKVINSNGNIIPLKPWISKAYFDMINN